MKTTTSAKYDSSPSDLFSRASSVGKKSTGPPQAVTTPEITRALLSLSLHRNGRKMRRRRGDAGMTTKIRT